MPLISNRKRRTSFNTMYKVLCVALCLIFAAVPVGAAEMPAADELPESTDMLLLYDRDNLAVSESDVEEFRAIASAMGKSLTFGDIKDFKYSLRKYEYVFCYRLEEVAPDEMRAVQNYIQNYNGNVMIFGSDFMKRYLRVIGQEELIVRETDHDRGVLMYDVSTDASFEEIVDAENITEFYYEGESRGYITVSGKVYPFFSELAGAKFTPVTSLSAELTQAALIQELTYWMWPYRDAPPDYGQYLVLDEIYPFMDPAELLDKIDILIDEKIPFVLSVMPIYKNTNYPAMVQFCQVLQYAQQNGGFVVMHAPIVQAVRKDTEEMYNILTDGLNAYLDNGVYPLGIEVPADWTNDDFYIDILKRYRTVFVKGRSENSEFSLDTGYNKLYYNYHQLIMPVIPLDKTGASYLACYSSAVYIDSVSTDKKRIRELIDVMKQQRVPFQDLWALNHTVWADGIHLSYERKNLYLNDELVSLTFEPVEYDEDFDYNRDIIKRITISIQEQNKVLTILTVIIVAMFGCFMIYLRRLNKHSFFFEDENTTNGYDE